MIGHDGKAHNVTMVPGDLVLYESHSVIHGKFQIVLTDRFGLYAMPHRLSSWKTCTGRPFPLKGRFMANIFVHFVSHALLTVYERSNF